ncbi:hypothetical protein EV1_000572 [Malus domestica]
MFPRVLTASALVLAHSFGAQVHGYIVQSGFGANVFVRSSLVDMYVKCGGRSGAKKALRSMEADDVVSWNSMIVGCLRQGFAEEMKIDHFTYLSVLNSLAALKDMQNAMSTHCLIVKAGLRLINSWEMLLLICMPSLGVKMVYGIQPGPEHYACMIDLLGRSWELNEAEVLVNEMVVEPDGNVWKALLTASRVHGNIEMGERAATNLFKLEPLNAVPSVQLSNMCSAAARWEDAARIRRLPGCSWIETNSQVHTFMSEDTSHSRSAGIYSKVDELMILIKEAGYHDPTIKFLGPDMNFAKELDLAYHAEKLAVAFGLLTTPPGAPIRIFKMKFISRLFLRHIILRDSN